jgi:hypothetical protein
MLKPFTRSFLLGLVALVAGSSLWADNLSSAPPERSDVSQVIPISPLARPAQADFDGACELVKSFVLHGQTDNLELYGLKHLYEAGSTRLTTWNQREIAAPWDTCWVFFCDDAPAANWAHPCRYFFVAHDCSVVAIQDARTPLTVSGDGAAPDRYGMSKVISFSPPVLQRRVRPTSSDAALQIQYGEGRSNYYALIVSGGWDTNNNAERYWIDCAFMYSTLVQKYGYPKTNLYVLVADGTNPAPDYIKYDFDLDEEFYLSTPPDFDGDETNDITGEASLLNVSNAFLDLQRRLTPNDQLLMFTIDHGRPTPGGGEWDVELALWFEEVLTDKDLKAMTTNLPCPILFVMGQCMSGGFSDDLNQSNRLIATAAEHDKYSFGDWYFDPWCYGWAAAMRGCFMPTNHIPWEDGQACNADYNGDGYVSFREAAHFADLNTWEDDSPTYQDVPAFLGGRKFLGDVPEAPVRAAVERYAVSGIRSPEAANHPADFQVYALNPFGEVVTQHNGAVQLRTEADDIDPGVYVGRGKEPWDPPLCAWAPQSRLQVIYPTNLMGGARIIDDLALNVTSTSTPMNRWTIRMKHTSLEAYPPNAAWEASGWTTVYQANQTFSSTGWHRLFLTNSFAYNGVDSLMVDFSFSNEVWQHGGMCMAGTSEVSRAIVYFGYVGSGCIDPFDWSGTNNPAPELKNKYPALRFGPPPIPVFVDAQPTNLTAFTNGIWNGNLLFSGPAHRMRMHLISTNAYWNLDTDYFTVLSYLFELAAPEADPNGTCRLSWASGTGATYRIATSTNLLAGYALLITNLPATPPLNVYTTTVESVSSIFHVEQE